MLMTRLVLLVLLTATAQAQTVTLTGHITDETGAIIPNAKVIVNSQSTTTNETGTYTFTLSPGVYTIQATAPGLAGPPTKITVRPGPQTLNLALKVAGR